ncbi:MAG: T9SS type A sorting domain-containing protein [Melioribacteraceae bacterium]|nr:T9SS type A sorting domain-containing protein [Melioribacteraceae bacterium]
MNENLAAGVHTVDFDASNLNSGIYFYELKTGNFLSTKKMIILK